MTYLGTRPILQDELRQYELHHRARIAIKPGITGMWQVSGRSDMAKGEYIIFLNAGDMFYEPDTLKKVEEYIEKNNIKLYYLSVVNKNTVTFKLYLSAPFW